MSKVISVSALDYCQPLKLHPLTDSVRQALPISTYKLPNGEHQVISFYHDNVWRFEDSRFPSNINDARKKIYFNTMPKQFVEAVKFALKHYDIKQNPAGGTLIQFAKDLKPYLKYLDKINIKSTTKINQLICANYVTETKASISKSTGKPLTKSSLRGTFRCIELLYRNLKETEWAFDHPWPESSANHVAGDTGHSGKKTAKTEVIEDDELKKLISYCNEILEQAYQLIEFKSAIEAKRQELIDIGVKGRANIAQAINKALFPSCGCSGLAEFNRRYNDIPTATAIIILTFSGIRSHELCAMQTDAYRVEDNEDDIYYWLKSHSSKTYEGYTEWLVPEIVITAIEVQKAFVKPLQEALWSDQKELFKQDPHSPRALKIDNFKDHLFLTKDKTQGNQINSLTAQSLGFALEKLGSALGVHKLAPHRFRRTFAVYVAKSAYGDLRYLKKHFKHWSMDMTLLYTFNDSQSEELYNEIAIEIKNFKIARVEEFLEEDTIISGGLANKIISYRSRNDSVRTFASRAEMAEKVSDTVHLRSTGHSWCTSDVSACGGRSAIECTRCIDCDASIIEKKRHGDYFKGIYIQQLELRQIDDIGEAGKQRVERDIERCERVLKDLGMWEEVRLVSNV
jgi:integrase